MRIEIDFYDMKKGLPKDRDDKMSPLFREMSDADYKTLQDSGRMLIRAGNVLGQM